MKSWIRFGLLNAAVGFAIVGPLALVASDRDFAGFAVAAPVSACLVGGLFWSWLIPDVVPETKGKIWLVGILTGILSHPLTWLLLSLTYWQGCFFHAGCSDPYDVKEIVVGSLGLSFYSVLLMGWLTVTASIIIGFQVKRIELGKNSVIGNQ